MKKLKLVIIGILIVSNSFAMGSRAIKIAEAKNIEGKHIYGECLSFAKDLYNKMKDKDIECYFLEYSYQLKDGRTGAHAIVVFRDEKGQLWGMDNLLESPKKVFGTTQEEWIKSFYENYSIVIVY